MNIPIIKEIWSQSDHGVGYLANRNRKTEEWTEVGVTKDKLVSTLWTVKHMDYFFSVRLFSGSRKNDNATETSILYADLDGINPRHLNMPPTIWWSTTPGKNYQGVWFLTDRVPNHRQRSLNRRLTYHIGADSNGWSASKMLRVPLTTNWKRGGIENTEVMVDLGRVYDPDLLDQDLTDISLPEAQRLITVTSVPDDKDRGWILKTYWPRLSLMARSMLVKMRPTDRSLHIIKTAKELHKCGLSREEIFQLLHGADFNKFKTRPDTLFAEIDKAVS